MCIRDSSTTYTKLADFDSVNTGCYPSGNLVRTGNSNSFYGCLLYTSDAADERSSVDLGGRRIIKKKQSSIYNATL